MSRRIHAAALSISFALVVAGGSARAQSRPRHAAAAQAANTRGMKLLGDKTYKDAMAAFEQAIAADDRLVLGQPGAKQKRPFRWSSKTFQFEEVK